MRYEDILEFKKKAEFRLTDYEILAGLVNEAQQLADRAKLNLSGLSKVAAEIVKVLKQESFIQELSPKDYRKEYPDVAVGIDGSCQVIGGEGGLWYAPISVARIVFPGGVGSKARADAFWATIAEIQEEPNFNPQGAALDLMLAVETKAILDWGTKTESPSIVFIDGPIADPPYQTGKKYVADRCQAIRECIRNSMLIGCVKRSRDSFFVHELGSKFDSIKSKVTRYPSDQHLWAFLFSHYRQTGYSGPLISKWVDLATVSKVHEKYQEGEIRVCSLFFQKDKVSQILRLDVAFPKTKEASDEQVTHQMNTVAAAASDWTYPGQDYPLPVYLAHNKCNIRVGCAETLYEEIITKSRTASPTEQIVLTQLR